MTPGIEVAQQQGIGHSIHGYSHDPSSESCGLEAAEKLGIAPQQVFKTLVVQLDGRELAVAVLPVSEMLSMKLAAKALGAKKATMADKRAVERTTGYVTGGISPLGQKKRLRTVIDGSALNFDTIYISAGRRGLEIQLAPGDLKKLLSAAVAPLCA